MGQKTYNDTTKVLKNGKIVWTGKINKSNPSTFEKPARVKEPSIFFVNSMSDFFHDNVPYEWQVEAMEFMAELKRHQFQILTKRPENILKFSNR